MEKEVKKFSKYEMSNLVTDVCICNLSLTDGILRELPLGLDSESLF